MALAYGFGVIASRLLQLGGGARIKMVVAVRSSAIPSSLNNAQRQSKDRINERRSAAALERTTGGYSR
jgi:hypothetical protein